MNKLTSLLLLTCAFFALGLIGCSEEDDETSNPNGFCSESELTGANTSCDTNDDCGSGLLCYNDGNGGRCVEGCDSNDDCGAGTCSPAGGSSDNNSTNNNAENNNTNPNNNAENNNTNTNNSTGNPNNNAENNNTNPNNNAENNNTSENNSGGPSGLSCIEINQCLSSCGAQDQACQQDCVNQGTPDAQTDFLGLNQCLVDNCSEASGDAFQTCAQESCAAEIMTCQSGGGGNTGGGDDSCIEINQCINACGAQDQACQQGCLNAGTAEAQDDFLTLNQCLVDNCSEASGDEFQTCAQESCGAEIMACQGGAGGGGDTGVCLLPCTEDADCPDGQACQDVTGQGNIQCIDPQAGVPADAPSCSATEACPEGYDGCFITQ